MNNFRLSFVITVQLTYTMLKFITKSIGKLFGTKFDKDIAIYAPRVEEINDAYAQLSNLSLDDLRNKTLEFRQRISAHLAGIDEDIQNYQEEADNEADFARMEDIFAEIDKLKKERDKHLEEILNEILPEAFAVVKETCGRFTNNKTLTVTATDHDRNLAAKKAYVTIEGDKAVYQNSWIAGGGEITWNMLHYDVQLIGGMVLHDGKIAEMATGEGKTLVATLPAYLNGLSGEGEKVQRKHHYTMIDEVDSVLIDDARTPLIISGPVPKGADEQEYEALKPRVEKLIAAQRKLATDYLAEAKSLIKDGIVGVEEGEAGMALLRAHRALPKYRPLIKFLSQEGMSVLLQKTENHYMQEQSKNMHLVDAPLYFTIIEKTRTVDLVERGAEYLAKGGEDPSFFVMPDIALEIMQIESSETIPENEKATRKEEVISDFSIKSKRLHSIHQLLKAYTLFEKDEEYVVMDGAVKIVDEQTGRMMEGRRYSDGLHQQTYATVTLQNYFRMYHKLAGMTGTAETEAGEFWEIYKLDVVVIPTNKPIARDDREDMVFKTAREKFNAVADEIVRLSNAGRPVLVGTTSVDISETLSRMLRMKGIDHNVLNAKQHQREAEIVAEAGNPGKVTIATNMAGRGTDIKLSDEVKSAGGLAIIGTERHDSRRVDRQLRGRAGRQGDPGSSQFYVSLEDNLMRLFQSERIAKLMDKMGLQEGEVIQHSMVSKSIERAQKKVEENNFGTRKRLLEYDDVMNIQREAIYKKRNNALSGDRLSVDLFSMFNNLTETLVLTHRANGNFESFREESLRVLGIDPRIDAHSFEEGNEDNAIESFQNQFLEFYKVKKASVNTALFPMIKQVYENEGHRYKRIMIPYNDGSAVDEEWKEHLRSMDEMKDSTQAASFEQKDPLVVYKMEAFKLFEELVYSVNEQTTSYLSKGRIELPEGRNMEEAREQKTDLSKVQTSRSGGAGEGAAAAAARRAAEGVSRKPIETVKREEKKVGRNEACPCGSGKKYKHCHGK